MRQGKNSFRHDSLQDAGSIRGLLKSIIDGLAKGRILVSDEDDRILMEPEGLLHLRLRATQEENRQAISIKISWQKEDKKIKKKRSLSVSSK